MAALRELAVKVVLSSRPVPGADRLANESFALVDGRYHFAHQKHDFPAGPGWGEDVWFTTTRSGFDVVEVGGVSVAFLLCTELFFSEWACHYRRLCAHVIVAPRASVESVDRWLTAASLAVIVSGCYVVSSNRTGRSSADLVFGGRGFAIAPDGSVRSETSRQAPVQSIDIDLAWVRRQQSGYLCSAGEIDPRLGLHPTLPAGAR